jgi:hypothetical protein
VGDALKSELRLGCTHCEHEWLVPLSLPMPVPRFVALANGLVAGGCPACGTAGRNVVALETKRLKEKKR